MKLDAVYANVPDIDAALATLRAQAGLKPFLRFELVEPEGNIPLALVPVGDHTLELSGGAAGLRPETGVIERLEIAAAVPEARTFELGPGAPVVCTPASRPALRGVAVASPVPDADAAVLVEAVGAEPGEGPGSLRLGSVAVTLAPSGDAAAPELPGVRFPGWHRIAFSVDSLDPALRRFADAGTSVLLEPFQVMPGLDEAMVCAPSGLVLQVTRERLGRMMPVLAWEWLRAKLARRAIRFSTTPANAAPRERGGGAGYS